MKSWLINIALLQCIAMLHWTVYLLRFTLHTMPNHAYSYRCKWFFNFGSFCIHFIICDWISFRDMHIAHTQAKRERERVPSTWYLFLQKKEQTQKWKKNRANQKIRILMWIPYRMFMFIQCSIQFFLARFWVCLKQSNTGNYICILKWFACDFKQ